MKFKRKWVTVWTLKTSDGTNWYGTCQAWADQPVPDGAVLTKSRVLTIGAKSVPCAACGGTHVDLAKPHID